MLIKETEDKVNFIDKNDNFVGYDMYGQCCEYFGWYVTDCLSEDTKTENLNLEGYYFDTQVEPIDVNGDFDSGGCVAFRCVNDNNEVRYLHLFNDHNGYYSHGWDSSFGCEGYL